MILNEWESHPRFGHSSLSLTFSLLLSLYPCHLLYRFPFNYVSIYISNFLLIYVSTLLLLYVYISPSMYASVYFENTDKYFKIFHKSAHFLSVNRHLSLTIFLLVCIICLTLFLFPLYVGLHHFCVFFLRKCCIEHRYVVYK